MATSRGRSEVKRFMAQLPSEIERKLLRGAAKAAIGVVKDEAADRTRSSEVREALHVPPPKVDGGLVTVKLTVKGQWPQSLANWEEYGTAPHVISVADDRDRQGMSVNRINKVQKAGTLVIGGNPVGKVVHHPGVQANPFLRPALDIKEREAIAAAQNYINSRVRPSGIVGGDEPEGDA